MSRPVFSGRAMLLLLVGVLSVSAAAETGDRREERGFPTITVYEQRVHHGGPQTFGIAQHSDGVLYFGNLGGVLTYDGAWWRLIKLPNDASADSIATDEAGRIALGSLGQIGHLEPDASGSLVYRSLVELLPQADRDFGELYRICPAGEGFIFLTASRVFSWDGGNPRVVARFENEEDSPGRCFAAGATTWVAAPGKLYRFIPERSELREVESLSGSKVDMMLPRSDGSAVVAIRDRGMFELHRDGADPFAPEASKWLAQKRVTGGNRLPDGRMVVSTREHGVIVIEPGGEVEQVIDQAAGLPELVLWDSFVDREGTLWLAFDGPIVRVDLSSPVTLIDNRRGLKGTVSSVRRFDDQIFIATSHGLFALEPEGGETRARKLAGFPPATISLLPREGELLVGTAQGLYTVGRDRQGRIVDGTKQTGFLAMYPSKSDRDRIWVGTAAGVSSIRKSPTGWVLERTIPGSPAYASNIVERDGVLWCGTIYNGVTRIEDPDGSAPRVTSVRDGEEIMLFEVGGRIVAVPPSNEVMLVQRDGSLRRDPLLGDVSAPSPFFLLAEDHAGDVWMNTIPPQVARRQPDGTFSKEAEPLVQVDASDIQFLHVDREGIVWFGSDRGVYRYEPGAATFRFAQPAPLIRRVVAGNELLFGGAGRVAEAPRLPFSFRRLRVEFAPATFRSGIAYQFRLDPLDIDWSDWREEAFVDFTNLTEGNYTLRVRSRGPSGPSRETEWAFSVAPPWYRTPAAIILWTLMVIGIVGAAVAFRTRSLRRVAEELRVRVAERTDELNQTVEQLKEAQRELVRKNDLLEEANSRLERLSLVDDLTGVSNRRYFERALSDEWNRALRRGEPLGLVLLDLDHFKDLNDRRGHQAGDACLRAIGAFLAGSVRRAGDVVSRYGGEEFAILLPRSTMEETMRVAEMLRGGIERLAIAADSGGAWSVTASCGVCAITPLPGESAESLVEHADRALYEAKRSGRNRVCSSEAESRSVAVRLESSDPA